jgi:hypothetical protein
MRNRVSLGLMASMLMLGGLVLTSAPLAAWGWGTPWKKAPVQQEITNETDPKAVSEKVPVDENGDLIPPDSTYLYRNCEPIRLQVVEMNSKFFLVRPFFRPWIAHLRASHERCLSEYYQQEINYIKAYELTPDKKEPEAEALAPLNVDLDTVFPADKTR